MDFFKEFYEDFEEARAYDMLEKLSIRAQERLKTGSDAGWGKLKSGAGWIALDFCERV